MTVHSTPSGAPAARLCDDPTALDALVVTYWNFVAADLRRATLGVLGTRAASTGLLEATFDTAAHHGVNLSAARNLLASNPHGPLGVLREFLFDPTGGRRALAAASNPATGPWAPHVWDRVEPNVAKRFLCNVECPAQVIAEHFWRWPSGALANPACPAEIVDEHVALGQFHEVWSHPLVDPDRLRDVLVNGTREQRNAAVRNPTLSDDEVADAVTSERAEGSSLTLRIAEIELAKRRWASDPFNSPVQHLHERGFSAQVAATLFELGEGVTTEAAKVLNAGGFTGTVGELLAVAETFAA